MIIFCNADILYFVKSSKYKTNGNLFFKKRVTLFVVCSVKSLFMYLYSIQSILNDVIISEWKNLKNTGGNLADDSTNLELILENKSN
jgi:hypothetical protein